MRYNVRPLALGAATTALAVMLAAAFAYAQRGGTQELPNFAIWSLPLGLATAVFSRRPRFTRLPPLARAGAAAATGLLTGIGLTLGGYLLIGGWMLAWDFPVLYCWALAGAVGAVAAAVTNGAASIGHAAVGLSAAIVPLAVLAWFGARPVPAVLIAYRDDPTRDAAQFVLDSVLTRPHTSGTGRDLRWPSRSYSRIRTTECRTAALITLERAAYRDSIQAALSGHPLVLSVTDTMVPR